MSDTPELDRNIQQTLREISRLEVEAKPIKDRLRDPNDNHFLSDEGVKILLAPDKKFSEFYNLLRDKYPDLPPDED